MLTALARMLLSIIFLSGGANALQNTDMLTEAPKQLGLPEPRRLVQLHGVGMVVNGVMLALGILPRLASLLLAANLVPTTVVGHRFWEEEDEQAKVMQQIHFMKNLSLLGGLLVVAAGRKSVDEDLDFDEE